MQYYGTRLSENISRREPEGYLLCLNVPVARTGIQEYLPEELGLPPAPGTVSVYRAPDEVFDPQTIASFEGMPVTEDHPPEGVDIENVRRFQRGHAHNVRRGAGAESDLLLADLIITDPGLAEAILGGKREISCGYTYDLICLDGMYFQHRIRGNHIAVVDAGRAGPRVSIRDRRPPCPAAENGGARASVPDKSLKGKNERRKTMNKSMTRLLARMARDGDTETVAEILEEMIGPEADAPVPETPETPENAENAEKAEKAEKPAAPAGEEKPETAADEGDLAAVVERLDRVISLLSALLAPPAGDESPAEEAAEAVEEILEAAGAETAAPGEEEIAGMVESLLESAPSETLEENRQEDEDETDPETARDALRAAVKAFRPALVRMSPAQRRRVSAEIAANLRQDRKAGDRRTYAALSRGTPAPAKLSDLGKKIMAKRNANFR